MMNELSLGLSFNYVPNWSKWEVVRELTSNARDTGAKYEVSRNNGNLIIRDYGDGLAIKHLLIGESGSRKDGAKIGQFGEGLKNAILVLTRDGFNVQILSGNKRIVNTTKEIEGIKTLSFIWEETDNILNGTEITIFAWGEEEDYQDKFLNPESEDIITTTNSGSILETPVLYNQGVFIKNLPDYAFGYNINDKEMNNRDRDMVSESDLHSRIGQIWMKIDDQFGWEQFFQATKEKKMENLLTIQSYYMSEEVKEAFCQGFFKVFGNNAVLKTSEEASREAQHCGGNPIESDIFGYYLKYVLQSFIPSDTQFISDKKGKKAFNVPLSKLSPTQKKSLSFIKKMAKKVQFDGEIIVAEIPDFPGLYSPALNVIKIKPYILNDIEESKKLIIHELGHWVTGGAADLTESHVEGCCEIGVRLMK